jgi:cation transport ATPase
VSRAVVAEALKRGISSMPPKDLQEKPGLGVVAMVEGRQAILGRRALLADFGIEAGSADDGGVSQVWVAYGGRPLGSFVLRDQPRAEAREALAEMRALGIGRLILLTGDRVAAAQEVGDALGMDEVVAEVLPAQKLEVVRAEQAAGRVVMIVGDGVNDALALGGSDVGVAIGAELNEVALGGADVALLGTDLGRLPRLIGLADITRRVIGQNVWLAFGLSVVLLALAARGLLDPLKGALAQSVAVLVVVANSARILRFANQGTREPGADASQKSNDGSGAAGKLGSSREPDREADPQLASPSDTEAATGA